MTVAMGTQKGMPLPAQAPSPIQTPLQAPVTQGAGASPTTAPTLPPATDPAGGAASQAQAGLEQIVPVLQQLVQALQSLVQALQGSGALATTPGTAPTTPTAQVTPPTTAPAADPLQGFLGTGDATERATLASSLTKIGSTSVGAALLAQVRDKGIHLDIIGAAEFDQATNGQARDAAAVFRSGGGKPPAVYINSAALADPSKLTHVLAHELAHAAQYVAGEGEQNYRAGIGAAANGLSADQLATGTTLMKESGAELLASAINAQLQDPAGFAAAARGNIGAASTANWQHVNELYNPRGYQLPVHVSPASTTLVQQVLAAG